MKAGSEQAFQQQLVQLARFYGWDRIYHTHDSRRSNPGWPDLVICKPPHILFVEVKTKRGIVSPEQHEWIAALTACGLEAWIVRDTKVDFDTFHDRVSRGRAKTEPLYRVEAA